MKKIFLIIILTGFGLIQPANIFADDKATSPGVAQDTAIAEVKDTIDKLVKVVETFPGDDHIKERRDKMREIITPKFDFQEMSKRSLGAHWPEITPEQQKDFVSVFSDLLARTYLARIENIRANTVKIDTESVNYPNAIVKTTVTHKGDTFPIDYKLLNESSKWRVYDVVIENIGLVANYRNEFAGIIRKEQFDGLMKRLREKNGA
jgi:phospholipid transport system substrate-binding protein